MKIDRFKIFSGAVFLALLGLVLVAPDTAWSPLPTGRAFAVTAYPPYPPSAVDASDGLFMEMTRIIWSYSKTNPVTYFKIYRNTTDDSTSANLLDMVSPPYPPPASLQYDDHTTSPGSIFYYWIRSFNNENDYSKLSNGDAGIASGDLAATNGSYRDKIIISWKGSANLAGYELWRDSDLLTKVAVQNPPAYPAPRNFRYEDKANLQPSNSYSYKIRAYDQQDNKGNFSSSVIGSIQNSLFTSYLPLICNGLGSAGTTSSSMPITTTTTTTTMASSSTTTFPSPVTPGDVRASNGTYSNQVRLTWTGTAGTSLYKVFRSSSNNSATASQIGATTASPYDDTTATLGVIYYYWIKASNGVLESGLSNVAAGYRTLTALTDLQASQGTSSSSITLNWTSPGGTILSFKIFRHTSNDPAAAQLLGNTAAPPYQDSNATGIPAKLYYYWVKVVYQAGESPVSNVASGYLALAAPVNVSASKNDYCKIVLSWNATSGASGYKIYRHSANNSSSAQLLGTSTGANYEDKSAVAGTTYYFWVKATAGSIESSFSSSATGLRLTSAYPVCPAQ